DPLTFEFGADLGVEDRDRPAAEPVPGKAGQPPVRENLVLLILRVVLDLDAHAPEDDAAVNHGRHSRRRHPRAGRTPPPNLGRRDDQNPQTDTPQSARLDFWVSQRTILRDPGFPNARRGSFGLSGGGLRAKLLNDSRR